MLAFAVVQKANKKNRQHGHEFAPFHPITQIDFAVGMQGLRPGEKREGMRR